MAGSNGVLVAQSLNPVGTGVSAALIVGEKLLIALEKLTPVVRSLTRVVLGEVHHLHIFASGKHLRQAIDV